MTKRALLILSALLLPALPGAGHAQDAVQAAQGEYGSASDPATSCAANPHALGFIQNPPHLVLTWTTPKDGPPGSPRLREVYDLESVAPDGFTLREEGDYRPDTAGQGRFWVLQLTQTPPGYCWRRPDWPQVRCEDQQLRCEAPVS